jgi:type III secretion protein Q
MTAQVSVIPKSGVRTESAPDCRLPPRSYPPSDAGERREEGGALALLAISPAQVKALNAFYRRRTALVFSVAGHSATVLASWPPASDDVSASCLLDITVDGAAGAVTLSRALVEQVVAALDPDQRLDRLDPRHVALLLELAVGDALSTLEESLGCELAITAVRTAHDDRRNGSAVPLAFQVAVDRLGSSWGELQLQHHHAALFTQFLDRCALQPSQTHQAGEGKSIHAPSLAGEDSIGAAIQLPVAVCLRVGAATCSIGEIATLSPGDVVIADQCRQQRRTAVAVIAEHLVAPADLTVAGARIAARPTRARGSLWEWSMENGGDSSQADVLQKMDVNDIPVKLLFELGRIELPLAEIRQLAPGAIIPMSRPLEDSVDIFANGRRIGRGNLVQIGDSLGIRITRLFDNV